MNRAILRKYIPKWCLSIWHLFFAWLGAVKYGHPSEELMIIGITGTSGKSSTVYFLKQLLEHAGFTIGTLSTVEFCIAGTCRLNDKKMTMLGKMEIQRYLRKMVQAGCDMAIIETTSEGFVQHRHGFINYDAIILTNLYPEHIESHGSFENYKRAKLGIFQYVAQCKVKQIESLKNLQNHQTQKHGKLPKTCIVNANCEYATEFLSHTFDQKVIFGREDGGNISTNQPNSRVVPVFAKDTRADAQGLHFTVDQQSYNIPLFGEYNISNILAVLSIAKILKLDSDKVMQALGTFTGVPGRIERVHEAQEKGFHVIVDYAFEPVAMQELYKVVSLLSPRRIIHVFGSTGGGRDISRRFTVGEFVGQHANICIVTNEDPYDDDPRAIMHDVASAIKKVGKKEGENLFLIEDRREAIERGITMAQKGDIVLVTGKGSEQKMCLANGKMIDWDDREEVKKALKKYVPT